VIKVIVVSGDQPTIDEVSLLIGSCCPDMLVEATARDLKSGVLIINTHQPDLVMLDTSLKDGSGFELLSHFQQPDFKVIFISEYMEYAMKAIEFNALAYLLKPVDEKKFITAINKATGRIRQEENIQLQLLEHTIKDMNTTGNIILRTSEEIHSVKATEIIRVEADGNYSTFHIDDGREVIVSKPMKEFEDQLLENGFFRIHKSHMINIRKVRYFDKAEGGSVVMTDGSFVPVASRKRDDVIAMLENLS
jgi:two-component system LytT family response regulator